MTSTHSAPFHNFICSFKSNKNKPNTRTSQKSLRIIPPTDRTIDFGKHKGRMLGTLPSTYLKWVSNNLRAGDFEPWANLADQVLQHPLYQDRLEWEFADNVLNGNKNTSSFPSNEEDGAVSRLLEISERFGWDNDDKVGWSKVDFKLLGTSKGGRIPRKKPFSVSLVSSFNGGVKERVKNTQNGDVLEEYNVGAERRRERRERMRLKREVEVKEEKLGFLRKSKANFANGFVGDDDDSDNSIKIKDRQEIEQDCTRKIINSTFPGREALLKKVINSKRFS